MHRPLPRNAEAPPRPRAALRRRWRDRPRQAGPGAPGGPPDAGGPPGKGRVMLVRIMAVESILFICLHTHTQLSVHAVVDTIDMN